MPDEHASQEPARDADGAIAQKPKYEAPAIVDLSSPAKGAVGQCMDGSSHIDCWSGSVPLIDCSVGSTD